MSLEGNAITEYASLSGKIHTLVIDKTLSISGAAADAKAVRDAIDKAIDEEVVEKSVEACLEEVSELAEETARNAALNTLSEEVDKAIAEQMPIPTDEIKAICV